MKFCGGAKKLALAHFGSDFCPNSYCSKAFRNNSPLNLSKNMTLIRFVQRASILAGMTFAGLSIPSNPAHADDALACVIASNGKTVCGTLKVVERACITTATGSTVCGKFKTAREGQAQEEARNPTPSAGYRKEVDGVSYVLRGCRRSGSDIKCSFVVSTKKENKLSRIFTGKGYSSMVDSAGRTYPSSTLEYNAASSSSFSLGLSPGVDYVVDVNFENIPGQITQASLLNVFSFNVLQFRNIPLSN
jgi:hypothetical protein